MRRVPEIPASPLMSGKSSRSWWLVILAIVAALFLYVSLAGRTPKPQPQDEFPSEETPSTT